MVLPFLAVTAVAWLLVVVAFGVGSYAEGEDPAGPWGGGGGRGGGQAGRFFTHVVVHLELAVQYDTPIYCRT